MNSAVEWLRCVEFQILMQQYEIKGYATGSAESSRT